VRRPGTALLPFALAALSLAAAGGGAFAAQVCELNGNHDNGRQGRSRRQVYEGGSRKAVGR